MRAFPPACSALQALGDVALARGIKEVDRCLADDLRQAGGLLQGLDPHLQQAPLADLLLEALRQVGAPQGLWGWTGRRKDVGRMMHSSMGRQLGSLRGPSTSPGHARCLLAHTQGAFSEHALLSMHKLCLSAAAPV